MHGRGGAVAGGGGGWVRWKMRVREERRGLSGCVDGGLVGRILQGRGRRSRRRKVLVVLVGKGVLWGRWRVSAVRN